MRYRPVQSDGQPLRAGFSLVELLVVMTIIALMASLAFYVIGASGEAARAAATKSSIRVISGALRERMSAFEDATAGVSHVDPDVPIRLKNHVFRSRVMRFISEYGAGGNTYAITAVQAESFVRKEMFKAAFPQRLADMYGYDGATDYGGGDDSPLLARMYTTPGNSGTLKSDSWLGRNGVGNPATESSELLYLVMTAGDVFGLPPSDITGIDRNLVGDTDNDANLEFLDGWGRPLVFYNWPTRLIKDDGANYTGTVTVGSTSYTTTSLLIANVPPLSASSNVSAVVNRNRVDRDPNDPLRSLTTRPYGTPLGTTPALMAAFNLSATAAMPYTAAWYHDANTASQPLIVSAGPDGVLGLQPPSATTNGGADRLARVIHTQAACEALGDNLTNQQRGPQ